MHGASPPRRSCSTGLSLERFVLIGITAFGTANGAHPEASDSWQDRRSHEISASLTSAHGLAGSNPTVWRVAGARTEVEHNVAPGTGMSNRGPDLTFDSSSPNNKRCSAAVRVWWEARLRDIAEISQFRVWAIAMKMTHARRADRAPYCSEDQRTRSPNPPPDREKALASAARISAISARVSGARPVPCVAQF